MMKSIKLLALSIVILLSGCSDNDEVSKTKFGIFEVQEDLETVVMDGEINSKTLENFNELISEYPAIETIRIREVPGSLDDEINLQVSQKVHQRGISTHLMDNGEIASGGVDFFLAGSKRTKGVNTRIGVHAWGGEDDNGNEIAATDFPVGDEEHQPYIDYYVSVGFALQEAEAFYYFTINAASPDDIHWMTEAEIIEYKVLKD